MKPAFSSMEWHRGRIVGENGAKNGPACGRTPLRRQNRQRQEMLVDRLHDTAIIGKCFFSSPMLHE